MSEPDTLSLKIEGMHCGACIRRVSAALSSVKGVVVKQVDIGSAQVEFDPLATSAEAIGEAIRAVGFAPSLQPGTNEYHAD